MEKKVRYKMYKAGKNWVVASLVFGGTFLGLLVGSPEIGRADVQVNAQSSTTSELRADTATSSSVQAKTSTVAITDATEKNTTNTNEQVKSVADTISVQNDSSASKTVQDTKKAASEQVQTTANSVSEEPVTNQPTNYEERNRDNHWYLYNKGTENYYTGFQKLGDGRTVYYNNQGQMQYGQQNITNKWYLFDKVNGAMQTGFQDISEQNKRVYYAENGQMQYGQQNIGGKWYLFDKNTGAMQTGFQDISEQNKRVYYAENGQMQYGQQNIGGKWYLFDKNTGAMQTGFQDISEQNKRVYYAENGQMQYGQQNIGGKWYLFDKNTGAMQTGFQNISEQNKRVYYAENGQMQYGQQNVNGKWYLFDKGTGAMQHGLQYIKKQNKLVFYAENGQMQYGHQVIAGKDVYFNQVTGALVATDGFLTLGKSKYYFKAGQLVTGIFSVSGKDYGASPLTAIVGDGNILVDSVLYAVNSDGVIEKNNFSNVNGITKMSIDGDFSGISKENPKKVQVELTQLDGKQLDAWATVKWQGNSTLAWPKKGYRVKLYADELLTKKLKVKLPGSGMKTNAFNLKANLTDPYKGINNVNAEIYKQMTANRNNLSDSLVKSMPNYGQIVGIPVELVINGNDQGLYALNTYHQDKLYDLDKDQGEQLAFSADNSTKKTSFYDGEFKLSDFNNGDISVISPEKLSQKNVDKINELVALADTNGEKYYELEKKYLDVDAAIDYLVFTIATSNIDGIVKNVTYINKDNGKWVIMAYDLDATWDVNWDGSGQSLESDLVANNFFQGNKLLANIYAHHQADVRKRYELLRKNVLATENVTKIFDEWVSKVGLKNYQNDAKLWEKVAIESYPHVDYQQVTKLPTMIQARLANVDQQIKRL